MQILNVATAVLAAQPGRPDAEDGGGARVERWFLRVMLGVSAVAWSLLLLAELGWFRLGLVAFLVAVTMIGFGLRGVLRAVPPAPAAAGGGLQPALAAAAGILLCAALFLPPYHTEMAAGDATVYLNYGRQIARHGALEFEDPLLRQLSPASRAELFRNRVPRDMTGRFARFPGGFLIADINDPTVTAGFSPLFPVLTALGHALVSPQAALVVAPLFATLSLIGLCFVMAGVLAWLVATARGAPRWACAAGWFLGLGAWRGGWAACAPPGSRPRSRPSRCRRSGSRRSRCRRRSRSVS